jgi:hypothetical protein
MEAKVLIKLIYYHAMSACGRLEVQLHVFNPPSLQARDITPKERAPSVHRPTVGLDALKKKNISYPHQELNTDYLVIHPVAN